MIMNNSMKKAYKAERERAIVSLANYTRAFRSVLDKWVQRADFTDEESAHIVQAYATAENTLLALMKEESEE